MDRVVAALAGQQDELTTLLAGLDGAGWSTPTPRCPGWDVADVVLHMVQSHEMAIASATGSGFAGVVARLTAGAWPAATVDASVALMVANGRGLPPAELLDRWTSGAARLVELLDGMNLSTRVQWVTGELSARSMATTRLAEVWIHSGDIADAVGVRLPPTESLREIARLAWRTLPYAFARAGRTLTGPVAFRLTSPGGDAWDFVPDEPATTTITGPATDLCAVAAQRAGAAATSLRGEGPDAQAVLELVRTYA
ncbi:MAG TPA: maleylpyruvate isomerase family mycothiol-dependent enzyme [Candidatus Dormibacteraeota bacterium]|jgi:uncharacterized protein (TIGR03084 family)|nr:maleylpyruvate isomerase family mycothiol-dependent enzyme [Candidatus Dormibacteraeota bacterium]